MLFDTTRFPLCRFSGSIPVGLAALPMLTRLNLARNHFNGDLPRLDGATFTSMLFFNMSNNALAGSIPNEYSQMRMFKQSGIGYVDSNNVMRPITFTFDVSNNQLRGDIPSFLNQTVRRFFLMIVPPDKYLSIVLSLHLPTLQSVEMPINKQWLRIFLSGNQFSNTCAPDMQYLGLCDMEASSGGLSGGAVAGIVIGVLAAVALLAGMAWLLVAKKRRGAAAVPRMPSSKGVFERFEDSSSAPLE